MSSLVLIAAATLGVDYGWQPVDGQAELEYIVQIEPELVGSLQEGLAITSDLPPEIRGGVRRIRVVFGREALPREGMPPPVQAEPEEPALLDPPEEAKPVQPAVAQAPLARDSTDDEPGPSAQPASAPRQSDPQRPWTWLAVALLGLFASLGANVFQGWITLSLRRRHRDMVDQLAPGR